MDEWRDALTVSEEQSRDRKEINEQRRTKRDGK